MAPVKFNHPKLPDVVNQQQPSAPVTSSIPQRVRSYGAAATNPKPTPTPSSSPKTKERVPPADHGKAAWLFLGGCFWLEGLVWGLPYSYGVFEQYYSTHEPFASQRGLAAIGTTGLGLAYFVSPFTTFILQRRPSHRKHVSILGLIMITAALISASLTERVSHLIVTQGLLYGVGVSLLYTPFIFYLDEWFVKRKGLAFGVFWAGSGFAGSVVPLVLDRGLRDYGIRATLQAWAVFLFVTLSMLIYVIKPRLPPSVTGIRHPLNLGFLKTEQFWVFQFGIMIQGLGYFMPPIYLPSYASSIGSSPVMATLSVSLLNLTSAFGMIFTGFLIDQYHISTVLLISSLSSAMSVLFIWGFAASQPIVFIFAFTYGIFAGGYASTWTGCASDVLKETGRGEIAVIVGTMAAGRGFGCVMSGPVSEKLINSKPWSGFSLGIFNSQYGNLVLFTAGTVLLGSIGSIGKLRRWASRRSGAETRPNEIEPLLA